MKQIILKTKTVVILLIITLNFNCMNNKSSDPNIDAQEIIDKIIGNENVLYKDKVIIGDIDFASIKEKQYIETPTSIRTVISSPITFVNCVFKGKILASKKEKKEKISVFNFVIFLKNLTFSNCEFQDEVDMNGAITMISANFSNSRFEKKTNFEGAIFPETDIYFVETVFKEDVQFQRAVFKGNVNFMNTAFEGNASFQRVVFNGNAQFGTANFSKYTDFSSLTARLAFFANYANFADKVIFSGALFLGRTEFLQSEFISDASFKGTVFNNRVNFSKSVFKGNLDLTDAVFILGKPEINMQSAVDSLQKK